MQRYVTYATRLVKAKDVKAVCCESKITSRMAQKNKR